MVVGYDTVIGKTTVNLPGCELVILLASSSSCATFIQREIAQTTTTTSNLDVGDLHGGKLTHSEFEFVFVVNATSIANSLFIRFIKLYMACSLYLYF
jgi:hypothetical protein